VDVLQEVPPVATLRAASVLRDIDRYYTDQRGEGDGVATQVFRQLSDPRPKDSSTTRELKRYKNLDAHWHEWSAVVATCRDVAAEMEKGQ
jgi:precorrin-2 methylase